MHRLHILSDIRKCSNKKYLDPFINFDVWLLG